MKKILIDSCLNCVRGCHVWNNLTKAERARYRRSGEIHPLCELQDDEPSIPVSKIRGRIEQLQTTLIDREFWRKHYTIRILESLIGENEG